MAAGFVDLVFIAAITLCGYGMFAGVDRRGAVDELERLSLAFPAGAAAVGAVLFTLNVCGVSFDRPLVFGVLGCGSAAGLAVGVRRSMVWSQWLRRWRERPVRLDAIALIALVVALIVMTGCVAYAAMYVNWNYDTEEYHFPNAAIIFLTHHQPAFASMSQSDQFSFLPALFETYAALWVCVGRVNQLLPNLFPGLFLASWAALTFLASRRVLQGHDDTAAYALLLFSCMYVLQDTICGESTDFLPVLLGSGAVYFVARDLRDGGCRRLPVVVWLLGMSCWVKLHGAPFAFCVAAAYLAAAPARRRHYRAAGWMIAGPVLILTPYLVRTALTFGNPVYPIACRIFGGYLTTPWANRVVAGWWQPARPFFFFPDFSCWLLREPALLFGLPALLAFYRKGARPAVFTGVCAGAFLLLFLAAFTNPGSNTLRFVATEIGLFSWLGGAFIGRLDTFRFETVRRTARWLLGAGALLTLYALLLMPHSEGVNRVRDFPWFIRDSPQDTLINFGWIFPLALLLPLAATAGARRASPRIARTLVVLTLSLLALGHHRPFVDVSMDLRSTPPPLPDWSTVPRRDYDTDTYMRSHMSRHTVIYTLNTRRWPPPATLLSSDDPLMERLHHPGITMRESLEELRRMGVDYVVDWQDPHMKLYDGYLTDPVLSSLNRERYFKRLAQCRLIVLYQVRYPGGEAPSRPTKSHPMPWLFDFASAGPTDR